MKRETFGFIHPTGICVYCGDICKEDYIMHELCAVAYEDTKKGMITDDGYILVNGRKFKI